MRKEKPVLPKEPVVFTVRLSRNAEKFLDRLPDKHFGQIDRRLEMLKTNPRPHDSIQLTDRDKERRFDVGEYRVLYEVDDTELTGTLRYAASLYNFVNPVNSVFLPLPLVGGTVDKA